MSNLLQRALRASALSLPILAFATAFTLPAQGAFAASAAKHAHFHTRTLHARAQATTVPETIICAKAGCEVVPAHCRGVPEPGVQPGYQMLACP